MKCSFCGRHDSEVAKLVAGPRRIFRRVTEGVLSHVYASAGAYTLAVTAQYETGGTSTAQSGPLVVK